MGIWFTFYNNMKPSKDLQHDYGSVVVTYIDKVNIEQYKCEIPHKIILSAYY